jgi:competence protein ComEC
VGLAPLTLLFFQQLSVVGFVANLVAIPLVTLLITPLALLGLAAAALWTLAAGWCWRCCTRCWRLAGGLAGAVWTAAAAPPWAVAAGLLGGVAGGAAAALAAAPAGPAADAAAAGAAGAAAGAGRFELVAADVGQGTAVLVRTRTAPAGLRHRPGLLARGRRRRARAAAAAARARRAAVDLLMLSHRDSDHVGGAASLLRALPVARWCQFAGARPPAARRGVPHTPCTAGQRWQWDGVRFEVLHPSAGAGRGHWRPRANTLSCVLRVAGREGSAAAHRRHRSRPGAGPGARRGARAAQQRAAGAAPRQPHLVDAGLHRAVAPRVAVVQAGYRSRFGHPAPDVLARYAAARHRRGAQRPPAAPGAGTATLPTPALLVRQAGAAALLASSRRRQDRRRARACMPR